MVVASALVIVSVLVVVSIVGVSRRGVLAFDLGFLIVAATAGLEGVVRCLRLPMA